MKATVQSQLKLAMNSLFQSRIQRRVGPAFRLNQARATHFVLCLWTVFLLGALTGFAQGTTTVTSNPANGATGVSVSAPVVFTFSGAMDAPNTSVFLYSTTPAGSYPVSESWNSANTVLTCTPVSSLPANVTISWAINGQDAANNMVIGFGSFTTGTGGGGGRGGSGTNAFTTFSVGKIYLNQQLGTGAPTPLPDGSYGFIANTSLASNRTATAVTVTIAGSSSPTGLSQNPVAHEDWYLFNYSTNQTAFESSYPQGGYAFNVTGTPANAQVTATLPTSMPQPNAPHVLNFAAAQAVNASQPFSLSWDAFQNGTAADAITVSIDNGTKTIFQTPNPGTNGALLGTATSVTIPAGTLTANTTNITTVTFYHFVATTNSATATATVAYRATETQLNLVTAGSATTPPVPVVSKPTWSSNGFGFDVETALNQLLVIRYSTDLLTWNTLFTTNSPGTTVHIPIPIQAAANGFFRVQNGP